MTTPPFPLPGLRVLLADAGQRRSPVIRLELIRLRCQLVDVIDLVAQPDALPAALERLAPELLLVDCEQPTPELLAQLGGSLQQQPRPVLLFAEQMTADADAVAKEARSKAMAAGKKAKAAEDAIAQAQAAQTAAEASQAAADAAKAKYDALVKDLMGHITDTLLAAEKPNAE